MTRVQCSDRDVARALQANGQVGSSPILIGELLRAHTSGLESMAHSGLNEEELDG
jgi:hypothetical protein